MSAVLRPCRAADLDAILALNNAALPAVSELDAAALGRLWEQSSSLMVADVDGGIAGFLLLLDGPGLDYASLNYAWFSERYDRFAYVDRVVVAENHRGSGIGRQFYEWAIAMAASTCPVLCAEVNVRPRNQVSLDFHDAMDFEAVGEQDTDGGAKTVVMLARSLP